MAHSGLIFDPATGLYSPDTSQIRTGVAQDWTKAFFDPDLPALDTEPTTPAGQLIDAEVADFGHSLGEELLTPTRVYAADCLAAIQATETHALSHITGGGLANNLSRVIPHHLVAQVDRSTWAPAPVFGLIQRLGGISQADIEETLNMGVGMVMVCPPTSVDTVISLMRQRGVLAWDAGVVTERAQHDHSRAVLYGQHPYHT